LADTNNHRIQMMVLSSGVISTLAGNNGVAGSANGTGTAATFKFPGGVATDGTNLYVADSGNQLIRKIVISSGVVTTIAGKIGQQGTTNNATGTSASFKFPSGLVYNSGSLYVTDTGNHVIRAVSTTSPFAVTTFAGTMGTSGASNNATGTSATFLSPTGIATDGTNLFVSDENHLIRKVVIAGSQPVSTLAGSSGVSGSNNGTGTGAKFNYPRGLATDGTNLFVADYGNNQIRNVVISSGVVTTLGGTVATAVDADGALTSATLASPLGLAYTASKGLYITNSFNVRLMH
jgi:hypothetical protein